MTLLKQIVYTLSTTLSMDRPILSEIETEHDSALFRDALEIDAA